MEGLAQRSQVHTVAPGRDGLFPSARPSPLGMVPSQPRRLRRPAVSGRLRAASTVVAIVSAFFIIGITVGAIAVVAMSALRADRRGDPGDPGERTDLSWDDTAPDDYPRWPGRADNDFSGR